MITLRPYQHEAVCSALTELLVNQSTLLVLATGLGKTTIFIEIAKSFERTVIIAHRKELIDQAAKRVFQQLGIKPGIEMGAKRSKGETIIVGSIQTLITRATNLQPPDLVIIDEAHHAVSETYRMVLAMWPNAKILGVTATPDRQDQLALGNVFETVAYRYETPDAIADGWLAPITWDRATDINDLMLATYGRRTVIFTPNVAQAIEVADELGPEAGVVYGSLSKTERTATLDKFKAGELQYMVNCNILTEGFDCPEIEAVAMLRSTDSRAMFVQCLGRGLRLAPGKEDCLYIGLDLPKHSLECPYDPLDGIQLSEGWGYNL
jgi:superfamily II DNA or RNA helicase